MIDPKQQNLMIGSRSGFTLVEMLVSVALVLLMMSMFAAVFQIATNSVSTQQANAENDQKVRSLTTVIKADFAKRTFRNLQPFTPDESVSGSPTSFGDRQGYFYISTNNPDSASDDLIQFTINVAQIAENTDLTPYFGQATQLCDPVSGNPLLTVNENQPERDDASLRANSTASSSAAEVCYFIRAGNLYRRQVLIREPVRAPDKTQPQPLTDVPLGRDFFAGYSDDSSEANKASTFTGDFRLPGPTLFTPGTSNFSLGDDILTNDFYRYFDFAAFPNFQTLDPGGAALNVQTAGFLGLEALSNIPSGLDGGPLVSIGKPRYRFGFNFANGLSREHLWSSGGTAQEFMGRFLHAETSAPNFNWPQQPSNQEGSTGTVLKGGNPLDMSAANFVTNRFGVIMDFDNATTGVGRGGTRAQEDLILANVHEMKIEVLDERRGGFVVPGHGSLTNPFGADGDFHIARNRNAAFGPANRITGAVFDTWHPDNLPLGAPQAGQRPPYELYQFTPPHIPNGGITRAIIPLEAGNREYWSETTDYNVGDVVFPFADANGNGQFDVGTDTARPDWEYKVAFRCIGGTTGTGPWTSGGAQPTSWNITPGRRTTDNQVIWEAVDNTRALKAIRMTLRFRNEKSGSMRQLSLVLPVADDT